MKRSTARTRVLAAYLLLNAGLFLPGLLFRSGDPFKFQLNLELAVLFALWAVLGARWGKQALHRFAVGSGWLYVIALVYRTYTGILSGMYHMEANFYNDISFVVDNLPFFLDAMNLPLWVYGAGVVAVIACLILVFRGVQMTFERVPVQVLGRGVRAGLISMGGIAVLAGSLLPGSTTAHPIPLSSLTVELAENVRRSLESREKINTLLAMDPGEVYDYTQYSLSEKPDVFFIFVESYGSTLYRREIFTDAYLEMAGAVEKSLAAGGWSVVSALSEAPAWGGGSWMSYTSVLFGNLIQKQIEYSALKKKYATVEYPNIGRYFSAQGYDYIWVESINRQLSESHAAVEQRFYGPDRRITFETMDYTGPLLAWGPSVPDQFTLGFVGELVEQQAEPVFMVYLTQNLHYPWEPLFPVLDDWRELETFEWQNSWLRETRSKAPSWDEKYLLALENTLISLEEFITALEKDNSVIVLIGDHQPPQVSRRDDGFETMVHIISRDSDLLESFREEGFVDGMVLEDPNPSIRHEGLYSLFVRNFVAQYGVNPRNAPAYLPDGIQ